jgi:RDD family
VSKTPSVDAPTALSGDAALMGRRIGAFAVNLAIVMVVVVISTRFFAGLTREQIPSELRVEGVNICDLLESKLEARTSICVRAGDTVFYSTTSNAAAKGLVLPLLVSFANSVIVASVAGASVGKRVFRLRVARIDTGAPADPFRLTLRWAAWIVDGLGGFVVGLVTSRHRRVGDFVAGTVVVEQDSLATSPINSSTAPADTRTPSASLWQLPATPPTIDAPPERSAPWEQAPTAVLSTPDKPTMVITGPQWDAARNAYIQWEPASGRWMQFDDATQQWRPLT